MHDGQGQAMRRVTNPCEVSGAQRVWCEVRVLLIHQNNGHGLSLNEHMLQPPISPLDVHVFLLPHQYSEQVCEMVSSRGN